MIDNRVLLTLNEIFYSVQGESSYAGRRCVFVRLTACDLRCSWCDTPYAFYEGRKHAVEDILERVESFDCPLVEITGGEPLLQKNVLPLMTMLADAGRTVRINISLDKALVDQIDSAATARGLTCSAFIAKAAREKIAS